MVETDGSPLPFLLVDEHGEVVPAVSEFFQHLLADDASPSTLRSYGYELLAWFRFLWAVDVPWDRAGRAEARDFALWLKVVKKPNRARRAGSPRPGSVNPITGKTTLGEHYADRTRRHARAAIRSFYEYHREMHGRPLINPFPKAKNADDELLQIHHNPLKPFRRTGRRAEYQPKEPRRIPRGIPEQAFNQLFAALSSNRDRALIAFYISTGARASELLGVTRSHVAPEDQLITVTRKGSRALQLLPASTDAFVWLRLYQHEMRHLIAAGPDEPLWWTLRQPIRPLTYDAARMVFNRANTVVGSNWTLHDLRHAAAKRMIADPNLSLADVQWVLGHAHITTTQTYLTPSIDEVVPRVLAHHARQIAEADAARPAATPAPGYRQEVLQTLFGVVPLDGGSV
ncbi:tyrosine-type recombinase/integrase [Nonomuraea polychroma]|uniref:tyrosine-type recombinase/integrase n=1 Tax=Nonomuraea polychroma TaxID=46176 RepID=UPI003D8F7CF3